MRQLALTLLISFQVIVNASSTHDKTPKTEPIDALRLLMTGNQRFVKSNTRKDGQSQADVKRLSTGQSPRAIVLSCSDSRVPPEIIFDQKLGEIFVVRTAGQAISDNVVGSIEYAVEHLGSNLILVMGHTSCGAVKAAHSTLDGKSAGTPALDKLVKDIHPRIVQYKGNASPNYKRESWANAEGVAQDLVNRSALLNKAWSNGELWVVPSLYNLENGAVEFQDRLQPKTLGEIRAPASEANPSQH